VSENVFYEIQVQEKLDDHWSAWFDGLTLSREEDNTTFLRGPVADQAALHGLLDRTRDLGLTLISVRRIDPAERHQVQGGRANVDARADNPQHRGR
jgi:hypothetical protein